MKFNLPKIELPNIELPNLQVPELNQETMMKTLELAYEQTISGIPGQKTIPKLAEDYLAHNTVDVALQKIKLQRLLSLDF